MPINIIHYNKLDAEKLTIKSISEFKIGFDTHKKIEISYDRATLYVSTPKMNVPHGVGQYPPADRMSASSSPIKYHMMHSFTGVKDGFSKTPKVGEFYNVLLDMDIQISELLLARSGDILSEPTSEFGIIDRIYARIINTPKSDEYDPSCKMKLPVLSKQPSVMITNVFGSRCPTKQLTHTIDEFKEYMKPYKWVKSAFKFQYLYYINGTIYPSIELYQQKVYESSTDVTGDVYV
jgi:hypothetical protein